MGVRARVTRDWKLRRKTHALPTELSDINILYNTIRLLYEIIVKIKFKHKPHSLSSK